MPNLQQLEQPKDKEPQNREAIHDIIREQVIRALGTPLDLLKVQVRLIGNERYRVNVLVGANASSARVGKSYFIVVDGAGRVISATPKITKQY